MPANSPTFPNRLTVAFDLNSNGTFDAGETLLDIPNLASVNGEVPPTFKFGFAASTGGNTNIHEVNNVIVESINQPTLVADVSIVKKGPLYAIPNSTITYTITSTNNGPDSAESVLIQDPLPEGLSFVSTSDLATYNPTTRTVIWPAIPTLANGASETRTITATVSSTVSAPLTNTAYSTSSTFDPNLANNNSSQPISQVSTTIVAALADVVTSKTGTTAAAPGATVSYTISTVNNGPSTAENVTITDSIVPNLTGVTVSNGGVYDAVTGIVTFEAISLTNTASAINTVSFIAPASGSVSNTARSTSATPDPFPENNNGTDPLATVTTPLTPSADLVTTKTGTTAAAPGEIVTYTISTVNNGPSTAENVTITDTIIPGLTGVNGGVYDSNTGIVSFAPVTSLASGVTVTNTVSFIAPASGSVTNTARSTSTTADPTPGNNEATVTTPLTPSADLVTTKTGTTAAAPGEIVTYTISTVNNGPSTAENVTITDTILPGLTGVNGGVYDSNTGIVTFAPVASLASGVNVTNTVSFIAPASGSVTNTARSTSATADPTPGNNEATFTTPLTPSADLVTTKTGTTAAAPGEIVTYTISTVNNGPSTAENVTITDTILPGLTGVNGGVYDSNTGIVTFAPVASLASGVNVTNTVSFIAPASGSVTNTARSTSATADPTPGNNEATFTTPLTPTPTDNQPPVANNANSSLGPNSSQLVTGLGGSDPDGSIVSYTINTLPPADQAVLFLGDPANGGVR